LRGKIFGHAQVPVAQWIERIDFKLSMLYAKKGSSPIDQYTVIGNEISFDRIL